MGATGTRCSSLLNKALKRIPTIKDAPILTAYGNTVKRLSDAGVPIQNISSDRRKKMLAGKTFVFTGKLENYTRKPRPRSGRSGDLERER